MRLKSIFPLLLEIKDLFTMQFTSYLLHGIKPTLNTRRVLLIPQRTSLKIRYIFLTYCETRYVA